jgi:hypothetical protein
LFLLQGGFLMTTRWSMLYFLVHVFVFAQNHLAWSTIARNIVSVVAVQAVSAFMLDYYQRAGFLKSAASAHALKQA